LWCGQLSIFYKRMWFCNHMFYKLNCCLLITMMMNYVDEFLHAIDDDFYGVCMYWKMWCWLLTTCCGRYALVESYVHAFMMLVSDCISILATNWFLYPYWRRRILCIHTDDDYDTDVSKVTTLRWPVPHAYRSRVEAHCIT